jgi:phage tail sheath protein FI
MADISFNHGVRVFENDTDVLPMRTAQSAVVFLLGTAEDADASVFPLNEPVLIKGASNYSIAAKLGAAGTLKDALDAIFDQGERERLGAYVYVVRVAEGQTNAETMANLVGDGTTKTGLHAAFKIESKFGRKLRPRIFIAPGYTHQGATNGIATALVSNQGSGYVVEPAVTVTPAAGNTPTVPAKVRAVLGTGANAGQIVELVIEQPGEGYTGSPTIAIAAPPAGGTQAVASITVGVVGNPLVHEMEGVIAKFRAIAFTDGPNTTDEAAVTRKARYAGKRVYMCDPFGQVFDTDLEGVVSRPVSARFAGVQVRVDREIGFYKSVSNEKIYGIDGPSRPISYGDQTNYLNENFVGTIVSFGDGFRTWGNRVMDGNFLAVRRTKDFIADAIEEAWIAFVDKPMNDANIKFIVETGRAFMRTLEAEGYLLKQSSDMWLDPSLNEPTEMRQGRITFSIKFEPPPPMEDIRVIAHPNIQAYTLLLDRVRGAIEGGSLAVTNL